MPRFHRNSRALLRLFLILVIGMAFFGWQYADRNWRPTPEDLQLPALSEDLDWLNLVADLLEDEIEVFQSATSGGQ